MKDLKLSEMLAMQKELCEKYVGIWEPLEPVKGRNSFLWMIEELGETISVIKKKKEEAIMEDSAVRAHFVEELADVMMYFNKILLCYDISPEEFSEAYAEKHKRNMERDFKKEHERFLGA